MEPMTDTQDGMQGVVAVCELHYTVKLNPVTKKNSPQLGVNKYTGKPYIIPSKPYKQYEKDAPWFLRPRPQTPIDYRVNVKCLFYMRTHGIADIVGLEQAIYDILVAAGILKDDNSRIIATHDGSLSLKGYGFVGKEFVRLMDYCFYELEKNIVIVFHATEEKDGDNTRLRIKVEGQTKNNVWEPMDLGGFVEMYGVDRTIGFSNCERYFAKGTRGISGIWKIPTLNHSSPNDFLAKLFDDYNAKTAAEVQQNAAHQAAYDAAMAEGRQIIESVIDAATANEAMPQIKNIKHALTSEKEIGVAFNTRIRECGLFWDKVLKEYTLAPKEKGAE